MWVGVRLVLVRSSSVSSSQRALWVQGSSTERILLRDYWGVKDAVCTKMRDFDASGMAWTRLTRPGGFYIRMALNSVSFCRYRDDCGVTHLL